jgi:pyruvate-formate lyase-activating enzyme
MDYCDRLNKKFGGKSLYHCSGLNGGQIAVIPGFIQGCSSATHKNGPPTICEYKVANVLPSEFFAGLLKIITENQTQTGPCVGCRYLKVVNMPSNFASSFLSSISLHDFCGCNSQCIYCMGSEYQLPEKYIASFDHVVLFQNLLSNKLIKADLTCISWGGGEPTLLKSFNNTVDFLHINRIRQIINTSGIQFSPAIERALVGRTASVCVSVDSGTNETYAKVKRNPNCDSVWENIRRYASTGGDFIVKYIILSMNSDIEEVDSFVTRCQKAGAKKICISVDARSIYTLDSDVPPITLKTLVAASAMYNLAVSKKIAPYFGEIWLPEHIDKIEQIGNINRSGISSAEYTLIRLARRIKKVAAINLLLKNIVKPTYINARNIWRKLR